MASITVRGDRVNGSGGAGGEGSDVNMVMKTINYHSQQSH